jgi:hypothetical protein
MRRGDSPHITADWNTIDFMESESARIAKMEMWIAKGIGTKLVQSYPNRQWGVQVDVKGGVVIITAPHLSKEKGYILHIKRDTLDALARRAVLAAGEILERFNIARDRQFDPMIVEGLARDIKDDVISADAEIKKAP